MNICPCCSDTLIHHIGNHREYWLCLHCRAEMPNLKAIQQAKHQQSSKTINLQTDFSNNQLVLVK